MQINTTRFGSVEVADEDVIRFPAGLPGLNDCTSWVLLADAHHEALGWLQCTQHEDVALAVVTGVSAVYYPVAGWWAWNHRSGDFGEFSYPALWTAMLAVQSALLVVVTVTAALSLRRPTGLQSPGVVDRSVIG